MSCTSGLLTLVVVDVVVAFLLQPDAAVGAGPAVRALAPVHALVHGARPVPVASVFASSLTNYKINQHINFK
jgi:hypothetical protein